MEIISEIIDGRIEAVLRDDDNNPLLTLPRYKKDGEEYLKVPQQILRYIGRQQANKPLVPGEKQAVYEIINELKRDISSLGRLEKYLEKQLCETEIETTCKTTPTNKKKRPVQTTIDTKI